MEGASDESAALVVVRSCSLLGLALGALNGILIVVTRVPDIVVTLAMLFVSRARRSSCSRRRAAPPPTG